MSQAASAHLVDLGLVVLAAVLGFLVGFYTIGPHRLDSLHRVHMDPLHHQHCLQELIVTVLHFVGHKAADYVNIGHCTDHHDEPLPPDDSSLPIIYCQLWQHEGSSGQTYHRGNFIRYRALRSLDRPPGSH